MIQLANDPNASRTSYRPQPGEPSQSEGRPSSSFEAKPGRPAGHSWPFLSRYAARPARNEDKPSAPRTNDGS
jgi:hypothetical protein